MAKNILIEISKDEAERAQYENELLYALDSNSRLEYAEEQGIEKGIKQGIEQGIEQSKYEAAQSLLEFGDPVEKVAKVLKMPIEKVREIRDNMQKGGG